VNIFVRRLVQMVRAYRRTRFRFAAMGRVSWGQGFIVGTRPTIARGAALRIGDRVHIASGFVSHCHVDIGDDVMISSEVALIGDDHPFDNSAKTIVEHQPRSPAHVVLEGDNLIGYGAVIRGPVVIGRGAIVGAKSLVTSDVPANSIVFGSPARVRRMRREVR